MKNLAIYGGSFDPPQLGHLNVVLHALNNYNDIDELHVIPCFQQTGKNLSDFNHRFNMCNLMFGDIPNVRINPIECNLGGESLTLRTVQAFKATGAWDKIVLLVGTDVFLKIPEWEGGKELMKLVTLREIPRSPISSTVIRDQVANGYIHITQTTQSVREYINEYDLYRSYSLLMRKEIRKTFWNCGKRPTKTVEIGSRVKILNHWCYPELEGTFAIVKEVHKHRYYTVICENKHLEILIRASDVELMPGFYNKPPSNPRNLKISEIESILTRSGYHTAGECDNNTYYVVVRASNPHRWLPVAKVLSNGSVEVSAEFSKFAHPTLLTLTKTVAKLLGVEETTIFDDGSPF